MEQSATPGDPLSSKLIRGDDEAWKPGFASRKPTIRQPSTSCTMQRPPARNETLTSCYLLHPSSNGFVEPKILYLPKHHVRWIIVKTMETLLGGCNTVERNMQEQKMSFTHVSWKVPSLQARSSRVFANPAMINGSCNGWLQCLQALTVDTPHNETIFISTTLLSKVTFRISKALGKAMVPATSRSYFHMGAFSHPCKCYFVSTHSITPRSTPTTTSTSFPWLGVIERDIRDDSL
ncbi:uncharacterized protein K460DRAFT_66218 [Cucurbitaria berberidis CBS 394.84]|uniref:Uncharacterized protein n=1 Tax=Cucurbitaria berberidis CBS 394.84 TaxID=1168544 RepID=A0A9P4LB89_9PLEO|nr:uncharacterized protein K460DRAFT_66218 [Cucurbitaria berberidis CBS 394.84]KAF1847954.1 hypothetical protein K460DRAFT_66218 [Cucurbitaria berberidis CBS 394.84]